MAGPHPVDERSATPVLDRAERSSAWHVLLPLAIVVVALVALVFIPGRITDRNAGLRRHLTHVVNPLASLVTQLERSVASESSAARGYALTGEPFFADRFLAVNEYGDGVAATIDSIATGAGGEIAAWADSLFRAREAWEAVNFGMTRRSLRDHIVEHEREFEAVVKAVDGFESTLQQERALHTERIVAGERMRSRVTVALSVAALLAAGAALWLAFLLLRTGRQVLRRAREEAALRRIAQTMAEAEAPQEALDEIVAAVLAVIDAEGAHVQQVDPRNEEVEVVAVAGKGAPRLGVRVPYGGSTAEDSIVGGDAVCTTKAALAHEGRHMVALLEGGDGHLLIVPLVSEGEALGALILHRAPAGGAFRAEELTRSRLLADMAAVVLRRLRHYHDISAKEQALQVTTLELRALTGTLEERVRERTTEVRGLARELTLAEQRERRELAQLLHDDLQQLLFGLQLDLKVLESRARALGGLELEEELRRAHDRVGEAIGTTRRLTVDLSPPLLAGAGLDEALRWLAAHVEERFQLAVSVHVFSALTTPADDVRVLLFRIVRELLFNVVKHARTDCATVGLKEEEGTLTIEVADDGVGFEPEAPGLVKPKSVGGFGIRQAQERLGLVGGCLEITSEPGSGTYARVRVPVAGLGDEGTPAAAPLTVEHSTVGETSPSGMRSANEG